MKIRAVLFDLDGTLRDTREVIYEAVKYAISNLGGGSVSNEDLYEYIQHHTIVHKQFLPNVSQAEFEKVYFDKLFQMLPEVKLYHQAEAVLGKLQASGLKLAIVSSAGPEEIKSFLKNVKADHFFNVVVGDDGKSRRKPHPDPIIRAITELGVQPEECIMIGDMRVGIEAARAAKVAMAIGISHGFESSVSLKTAGAVHVVDFLAELPSVIEELQGES